MVARVSVRRAGGTSRYGQLVLLAALLFGIVTMHTWGHPSEHAGARSVAAPAHGTAYPESEPSGHAAAHGAPAPDAPEDAPLSGLDATAVCLALIGSAGAGLAGLGALRLLRRGRRTVRAPGARSAAGWVPGASWHPPPPPPLRVALAELSVLRI
ncbi:hypothetical protein AB0N23_33600 [Streptomyces sp. NPDC052644]|uniref:hypothetical protein n=1 Tax=unclassified Streptomyces TaxID=2593676 RepID=UPI00332DA767